MSHSSVKRFEDNVEAYLRSLEIAEKENLIYKSIREEGKEVKSFLKKFLKKYALLNIEKCMDLLKDNNKEVKKTGLMVSSFDKAYYSQDDLDNYYKLVQLI